MIKKKKVLSIFMTAAFIFTMVFGSIPMANASNPLSDIEGHWAQSTLEEMVNERIIGGYPDGTFKPNNNITRAEFASLIVRAFALEPGPGKVFDDTADHWAKDAVKTANYHGLVSGYSDSLFGPNDPVTREQIAVMIVNATKVDATDNGKVFTDSAQIAAWAKESVDKATAAGLIAGYPDGTFKPKANATRAEAAVVLDRGRKLDIEKEKDEAITTYDQAGTYGPESGKQTIAADVTISVDGVILRNTIIKGSLTISEEVGDGDVTLINVTVEGETFIRGGGKDSIYINGGQYNNIIIESTPDGGIRLVAIDAKGLKVIISEKAAGEEIILEGTFESVAIKADNVVLSTQGETDINKIIVHKNLSSTTINIDKNTTVKELVLDSVTEVNNAKDTVKKISGDKVSDSNIAYLPEKETSGGGGGGGGTTIVKVSAISVDPDLMLLTVDQTETIVATVQPTNATNKRVIWESSDPEVATVDASGKVTAVAGGTATITVTTRDGGYTATKQVIVGDLLVPAGGNIQEVIDEAQDGAVIAVAPSTYEEQLVIDKPLTLLGPNADISGTGVRNAEATITYPDDIDEIKNQSLVYVTADNVVVNGLSFFADEAEEGNVVREIHFAGYDNEFRNNRVTSYTDKIAVHFGIADSYKADGVRYFNEIRSNDGTIVKDNYIESTSSWSALYLQGRAGTVEGNTISGGLTSIQIQPYWNAGNGTVKNNVFYGYDRGIWHNRADIGSGSWLYEDNDVFAKFPTNPYRPDLRYWMGIAVQSHGTEGWGGSQPKGDGRLPELEFKNNTVDGANAFGNSEWDKVVGVYFISEISAEAEYVFDSNKFINVDIGVSKGPANLDLSNVLDLNTFPEGSMVIGDQIKVFVPEEGKVYNRNTGAEFDTIQEAVDEATEGDTILVGPGEYDVSYVDGTTKHYLLIEKPVTIKAADMSNKPVLVADYTKIEGQAAHQQATVHIFETENLALDGLVVHSISNYPTTFTKAVEITGSNNVTVKNCDIYDEGRTAIYIADPSVGKYTIADNYLDGAIVVANGAGNGEGGSEATITGNTINASISFTGKTNSGWDPNHTEHYPTIEGNIINGTDYGMLFNSRDEDENKLILDDTLQSIIESNSFPDGDIRIVQDSYEYYNATLHRKRLMLNTVVNETRSSIHPTIQDAIDKAGSGNTILLSTRTYTENVIVNKPVTITGSDSAFDKPVINGSLTVNHSSDIPTVIKNLGFVTDGLSPDPNDKNQDNIRLEQGVKNVTIANCDFDAGDTFMHESESGQGFRAIQMPSGTRSESITVENCTFRNGYYVTIQGYVNDLTVKDSTITNCKSGINVQGGNNLVVENTNVDVVAQAEENNTYCVRFINGSITGGSFVLAKKDGVGEPTGDKLHSAIIVRAGATGGLAIENATIDGEVVDLSGQLNLDGVLEGNEFVQDSVIVEVDGINKIVPVTEVNVANETQKRGYDTIQAAVDAADEGDTILVGPGEYKGHYVIDKQLNLKGAQHGVNVDDQMGRSDKTVIVGSLKVVAGVEDFSVDGFVFEAFGGDNPFGLGVPYNTALVVESDEVTIKNCIFEGVGSVKGPYTYSSLVNITSKTIIFQGNIVNQVIDVGSDPNAACISVLGNGSASIADNVFTAALGISAGEDSTVSVVGNTVENAPKEGVWFWPVSETAHLTIRDNEIKAFNAGGHDGVRALKIVSMPASINGETDEAKMMQALIDANPAVSTVELGRN